MNAKASAWDKFEALPDHWVKMDVEAIVSNWLIGKYAKVNHPETVLNPDGDGFTITEVKISIDEDLDFGRIFVRGKETMWFGQNSFKIDVCGF